MAEPPEVLFTEYEKGKVHEVSPGDTDKGNINLYMYTVFSVFVQWSSLAMGQVETISLHVHACMCV